MEPLVLLALLVLTAALGFLLGAIVGARRALSIAVSGKAMRTVSARLADFMPLIPPSRSAEDIVAGRVRIMLGVIAYDLPVLPRAAARRWKESLDLRFATLAANLEEATTPEIMASLVQETDAMYDFLLSYDQSHILPPKEQADEVATDAQILHAVLEVWRSVNPLADNIMTLSLTSTPPSEQPSGQPPSMDGMPGISTP